MYAAVENSLQIIENVLNLNLMTIMLGQSLCLFFIVKVSSFLTNSLHVNS